MALLGLGLMEALCLALFALGFFLLLVLLSRRPGRGGITIQTQTNQGGRVFLFVTAVQGSRRFFARHPAGHAVAFVVASSMLMSVLCLVSRREDFP